MREYFLQKMVDGNWTDFIQCADWVALERNYNQLKGNTRIYRGIKRDTEKVVTYNTVDTILFNDSTEVTK